MEAPTARARVRIAGPVAAMAGSVSVIASIATASSAKAIEIVLRIIGVLAGSRSLTMASTRVVLCTYCLSFFSRRR
jgi:hypothetical protein